MSIDVKSVPPWKLALLEKKRRQEEDERRRREEEESRLSRMPAWKRDILLKKQQQKNSLIFLGKGTLKTDPGNELMRQGFAIEIENDGELSLENSVNSGFDHMPNSVQNHTHVSDFQFEEVAVPYSGPAEEHLVPIQQNPWFRTDLERKKQKGRTSKPSQNSDSSGSNYTHSNSLSNHDSCGEPGVENDREHDDIEVFEGSREEEVEYGRGFVHKLLQKFSHLSTKDTEKRGVSLSPKRSHSTENLLDESLTKVSPRSLSTSATAECLTNEHDTSGVLKSNLYSSPKAHSMENLSANSYNASESEPRESVSITAEVEPNLEYKKQEVLKLDNDHDNEIAEISAPVHALSTQDSDHDRPDGLTLRRTSSQENIFEDELPKANIVSSTRSIFEKSNKKRAAPEPPKATVGMSPTEASPHYETHSLDRKSKLSLSNADQLSQVQNGSTSEQVYTNHSLDRKSRKPVTDETLKNIRAAGKVWYSTGGSENGGSSPRSPYDGQDGLNDKNANYTYTDSEESRAGPASVTSDSGSQSANQSYLYTHNNISTSDTTSANNKSVSKSTATSPKSAVAQKNQNNNLYSSRSLSNGPQSDHLINTTDNAVSPVSPVSQYGSFAKKRPAPRPPLHATTDDTKKHATVVSVGCPSPDATTHNDTSPHNRGHVSSLSAAKPSSSSSPPRNELGISSGPNRMKLHLDIESKSLGPDQIINSEGHSYRDLYFNSAEEKKEAHKSSAGQGYRDLYYSSHTKNTGQADHIAQGNSTNSRRHDVNDLVTSSNRIDYKDSDETSSTASITSQETGSTVSNGWTTSSATSSSSIIESPRKYDTKAAQPSEKKALPEKPKLPDKKVARPNSIIGSNTKARPKLADLKVGDSFSSSSDSSSGRDEIRRKDKRSKRPVPSGPGLLLVRPASNLVPTGATNVNNAQYFKLNQYNDVKTGVFEPAKKRPSYYDDDDVPVTNIDDVLSDDIPITNIDDISVHSRHKELDADTHRKQTARKYDFVGAGVICNRSLLKTSRNSTSQKVKISFNDSATMTYEYPSEQSLLEQMPPEPGDFDYPTKHTHSSSDETGEDMQQLSSGLRSTPGVGSAGGLSNYKSKYQVDYELGVEKEEPRQNTPNPQSQKEQSEEDMQVRPLDESQSSTWSNSTTSDLLF